MKEVSKIKALSLARMTGIISTILAFLAALVIQVLVYTDSSSSVALGLEFTLSSFVTFLMTFTLLWGAIGFVIGLLVAFIYNFLTTYFKGIEIEIK